MEICVNEYRERVLANHVARIEEEHTKFEAASLAVRNYTMEQLSLIGAQINE